ncbi:MULTISPECIES: response regulator [Paenibacillus]|uniref:response regulator n=1 Tax=Paenibacillus TaxID=44249 RepID=UPI002FE05902
MLRIAIVDDETSIREGLGKIIRRESEQYEVIGTFSNGQEALEFARAEQLDVVITDIRMPLMDGLELIKEIKAVKPETRCIIMSGFTDFEYARQALRYSAVDYLLKPINKKQLLELLQKLDEDKAVRLGKNLQLRSGLLISYMKSSPSLCPKLPELALPLPFFAVIVIKGSDMDALRSSVGLMQRQPQHLFDAVDTGEQLITLVSYYAAPPQAEDTARLTGALRQFPHPGVVLVGVSRGYSDPARLGEAFAEAKLACERGMYREQAWSCETFGEEKAELSEGAAAAGLLAAVREALTPPIQVLNAQETLHTVERQLDELRQVRASRIVLLQYCRIVLETAEAELPEWRKAFGHAATGPAAEAGEDPVSGPGPGSASASAVSATAASEDRAVPADSAAAGTPEVLERYLEATLKFGEFRKLLTGTLGRTLQNIREGRLAQGGKSVEIVKKWIEEHYGEPAELSSLAGMVYLTPTYLSKLFKQETGMTITDYLIEVRIKKAKKLLADASKLKIHEVGNEVGYPDPAYFNKLFKRIVGVTPNEYKRISQTHTSPS